LLLLTALTVILGLAAPALASDPTPLPPDQAEALATAPDTSASTTTAVDGLTALDASAQPDADTSIESGLTPQAAVGLAPFTEGSLLSAIRPSCWANAAWHQWGLWPYQQRITDTTYWCAIFGSHITYRSTTTTASGTLCGVNWRAKQLIAGGVGRGFTYFTMRTSAGFACPTIIPLVTLHTTHHQDVKRNDRGGTSFVGTG
jgi:hypothetical protein